MTAITIHLSEQQRKFVEFRAKELGIEKPEDYIEQLLREEEERLIGEYYMKEIQKGLDSGEPIPGDVVRQQIREQIRLHREEKRQHEQQETATHR